MLNDYIDMDMMLDLRNAIIERIGVDGLVRTIFKDYYLYHSISDFIIVCVSDSEYKDVIPYLMEYKYKNVLEYLEMFLGCDGASLVYCEILANIYDMCE